MIRSCFSATSRQIYIRSMSTSRIIDLSPPPYTGPRDVLDKTCFKKSFSFLGALVVPEKTGVLLRANELNGYVMDLPKIRNVIAEPNGDRVVLLKVTNKSDISPSAQSFLDRETKAIISRKVDLDYDYWGFDECLHAFLPDELREGAPKGFAAVGHIAHLNLLDEYLPYKHIIGELILDKIKTIETVVNKLDTINNQFRVFDMELIAGVPKYIVEHHESSCRFTFDFRQVYWNSRLHTEHWRLVEQFVPEDVIADVFAGVGPFVVPAAKKGCAVLGNDLNPESVRYMNLNVKNNRVSDLVKVFGEDGRDFIRSSVARLYDDPLPAYTGKKPSNVQLHKAHRKEQQLKAQGIQLEEPEKSPVPPRRRISRFVMNLPDSAINFLDAFRGIFIDKEGRNFEQVYETMPIVHCYCFTREFEPAKAEEDILNRVEEKLGHRLTEIDETSFYEVRSVAPNKQMYCISFRLPHDVAFGSSSTKYN